MLKDDVISLLKEQRRSRNLKTPGSIKDD